MDILVNTQRVVFDESNHHEMITIGEPRPIKNIWLNITPITPIEELCEVIFTYMPLDKSNPIVSICKIGIGFGSKDYIVGDSMDDFIMIIQAECNTSTRVEFNINVYAKN